MKSLVLESTTFQTVRRAWRWASCLLLACVVSTGFAATLPSDLQPVSDIPPVELAGGSRALMHLVGLVHSAYVLPAGRYLPLFRDEKGVYYACPSGLVLISMLKDQVKETLVSYLHLKGGGIYLPSDPLASPKIWFIAAGADARAGKLKLEEPAAKELMSRCSEPQPPATPVAGASGIPPNPVIVTPNPQSVSGVAQGVAVSFIVGGLLDALFVSGDGKVVFPAAQLSESLKFVEQSGALKKE